MSRNLKYLIKGVIGTVIAVALMFAYSSIKDDIPSGAFGSPVKVILIIITIIAVIYSVHSLVKIVTYTPEEVEQIENKNIGKLTFTVTYPPEYDFFMTSKASMIAKEIEKYCPPDSTITIE